MSRVRSILWVLGVGLLMGCLSPTLPLPPPDPPSESAGSTPGTIHLVGHGVQPESLIIIENMNQTLPPDQRVGGTLADANGNWEANVIAGAGDVLHISQQVGSDQSAYLTYTVP